MIKPRQPSKRDRTLISMNAKQNNLVKMQVHKNKDEAWQRPKFSIRVVTRNPLLVFLPIIKIQNVAISDS